MGRKHLPCILIADDDESMRDVLQSILYDQYKIYTACNGSDALQIVKQQEINLVLMDIQMPIMDGLTALKEIKQFNDRIEVIMITVIKDIATAVTAIQNGAYNFINKDFDYDEVRNLVAKAIETQTDKHELVSLKTEIATLTDKEYIIGNTDKMCGIYDIMKSAAPVPATVLITGESGTGKELMARTIYKMSHLADRPFVTVNLAAIPDELVESTLFGHEKGAFTGAGNRRQGKFELADRGTLFLDEIGELKFSLQCKLLRFLQEGEIERIGSNHTTYINTRLIAATNVNLKQAVENGSFRKDLFYRLNVVPIQLPPLRERQADIAQLATLFVERYCIKFRKKIKSFTDDALSTMRLNPWPGNIREFENLIERLVATTSADIITEYDLPMEYQLAKFQSTDIIHDYGETLRQAMESFERNLLTSTLELENWHQGNTAKRLAIHRKTLEYKIKKFNLEK